MESALLFQTRNQGYETDLEVKKPLAPTVSLVAQTLVREESIAQKIQNRESALLVRARGLSNVF